MTRLSFSFLVGFSCCSQAFGDETRQLLDRLREFDTAILAGRATFTEEENAESRRETEKKAPGADLVVKTVSRWRHDRTSGAVAFDSIYSHQSGATERLFRGVHPQGKASDHLRFPSGKPDVAFSLMRTNGRNPQPGSLESLFVVAGLNFVHMNDRLSDLIDRGPSEPVRYEDVGGERCPVLRFVPSAPGFVIELKLSPANHYLPVAIELTLRDKAHWRVRNLEFSDVPDELRGVKVRFPTRGVIERCIVPLTLNYQITEVAINPNVDPAEFSAPLHAIGANTIVDDETGTMRKGRRAVYTTPSGGKSPEPPRRINLDPTARVAAVSDNSWWVIGALVAVALSLITLGVWLRWKAK